MRALVDYNTPFVMASYNCALSLSLLVLLQINFIGGEGFPPSSELIEKAQLLSHYSTHSITIGRWHIFPYMAFSCNCSITGWTFIITEHSQDGPAQDEDDFLQFQIWRKVSNIILKEVANIPISRSNISILYSANSMGMSLVEITLDDAVNVEEGDIYGIFQPNKQKSELVLQFQSGLAPGHYYRPTNTPTDMFSMRGVIMDYDYPLVAVKHGCDAHQCVSGFISSEGVEKFFRTNRNTQLVTHPGVNRVLPALNFTCDTRIIEITVGGKLAVGSSWPRVEIWGKKDDVYTKIHTLTLTNAYPTSSPGVYKYLLPAPLSISANNAISLHEPIDPALEVYSEENTDMFPQSVYVQVSGGEGGAREVYGDNDRPLLRVETDNEGCTDGFISGSNLAIKSLPLAFVTDYNMFYITPDMRFPRTGNVTRFIFGGQYLELTGSSSRELFPEIQVWRLHHDDSNNGGDTYIKIGAVGYNNTAPRFSQVNVYEYVLETPLLVQKGDVLGYYQPPSSDSLMGLVSVQNMGQDSYFVFGQNPDTISLSSYAVGKYTRTPLVNFEYDFQEVPTEAEEGGNNQSDSRLLLIIGATTVGVVTTLLIAVLSVVVCALIVRGRARRKGRLSKAVGGENIQNPTYEDTTPVSYADPSEFRPSGLSSPASNLSHLYYADPGPGSPYEQPTPSRQGTLDGHLEQQSHRSVEVEKTSCTGYSGTGSNVKSNGHTHTPDVTSLAQMSHGVYSNGGSSVVLYGDGIYHEPSEVLRAEKTYVWGVYVPTEEQRASIYYSNSIKSSEHLYSALSHQNASSTVNVYDDNLSTTSSSVSSGGPAFFQEEQTYWRPASDTQALYHQLSSKKYRELVRKHISISKHLGSGQFGTVSQGVWSFPKGPVDVAVKTLKPGSQEMDKVKFLQEAAINGQFQHPNVVKLIGVVTIDQPVMIVLELMSNGNLRNHLITLRPSGSSAGQPELPQRLLKFCQEVASGMEYLAGKAFVHRDLAARNVLMSHDLTCKISDFGMSRDLDEETYYMSEGGKIPIKWTAPEALHYRKYSTASDVWSYGMVLYEIWSLGRKPFSDFTNSQTVSLLERAFCLPPPPGTPYEIYRLMVLCWHPDKSLRPSFPALCSHLRLPAPQLLHWNTEDTKAMGHCALMIGAPLKSAHSLHMNLQNTYRMNA